jgi:Sulfotransferase family
MTSDDVILYLHIPKTGGTTLNACIYDQWCDRRDPWCAEDGYLHNGIYYFPVGFFKKPDLSMPDHVMRAIGREDIRAVLGHFWFGIHHHVKTPSTYITVLREPVERTFSLYWHLYRRRPNDMSLLEFVSRPPYIEVDNDQTRRLAGIEPELNGCGPDMLNRAKENLRRSFRVVGLTERFDETLILLKRMFGWQRALLYYPKNESSGRPRANSLSPDVIAAIRKRNELDLELYDFARQLLDEAIAAQGPGFRDELETFRATRRAWLDSLASGVVSRTAEHA